MVNLKINGVKCKVFTRWEEVDTSRLLASNESTIRDEIKALSTIPHNFIDKADDVQLFPFVTLISFIYEAEMIPAIKADPINIKSYNLFEKAKKACSQGKPYQKLLRVAKVYYPDEKNVVRLIGLGLSIVHQIAVFLEHYQDMIEDPGDPLKVQAGVEELTAFGHWGTAFNLAGHDLEKVDRVLEMPTIKVYTALHYSWRESKFREAYLELKYPKKKPT